MSVNGTVFIVFFFEGLKKARKARRERRDPVGRSTDISHEWLRPGIKAAWVDGMCLNHTEQKGLCSYFCSITHHV